MFPSRQLNHLINRIYKRTLQIVYNNKTSKDNSVQIYHKHVWQLKYINGCSNFYQNNDNHFKLTVMSARLNEIWECMHSLPMWLHMYIRVYTHTNVSTLNIHVYTHTDVSTYVHTCIVCVHIYMCGVCPYVHTSEWWWWCQHLQMCAFVWVCMYAIFYSTEQILKC